jgi:Carbohydrate-binding module 48 (Isoamylase N-terminal domain)
VFETEPDILQRVIERLREPVELDPALDSRVMARVAAGRTTSVITDVWAWLRRPWQLSISPLGAAAAVLIAVAAWVGGQRLRHTPTAPPPGATDVQFVIVAPGADAVSLVGDFNDWDAMLTPMHVTRSGGLWSVTIPLSPGRHRYAFLVNGKRWLADPSAPRAQDDFGAPSSVVTVGG